MNIALPAGLKTGRKETTMNRADAMEIIRVTANEHGFEFEQYGNQYNIRDGFDWLKSWVNFTIFEDPTWNTKSSTIIIKITVAAATARMGGSQSINDLYTAADTIKRAADLVSELNDKGLSYTVDMKKEG